jgi:beta-N-acetylhexosaminidase
VLKDDFAPFIALNQSPAAMIGHVVYSHWDACNPATLSPKVIEQVIRGQIGFDGLLFSDDLHMEALSGDIAMRAAATIAAGCDIALACWARGDDVRAVADAVPDMNDASQARLQRALFFAKSNGDTGQLGIKIAQRDALIQAAA